MPKLVSLDEMLKVLLGAKENDQLSVWEDNFILSIADQVNLNDGNTDKLTEKQVNKLEQIWVKHFGNASTLPRTDRHGFDSRD